MNYQWYPGHMTKARRQMQEDLKLIDLMIELVDARVPAASRNPDIDELGKNKARLILLNKSDLADERGNDAWMEYFKGKGYSVVKVNSRSGAGMKAINSAVQEACKEKIERDRKRGILNRPVRAMVVGIPNVGKSSFINKMVKKNRAKVEDRPGVTRGNQWYTIAKNLEMLDTPGVLWPKFDDKTVGEHLAFTGAVKDQILDIELLAVRLLDFIKELKPADFITRFKLENEDIENIDSYELLKMIGKKRGMLVSGGEIDTERAAIMLLDEFRSAKLGRITVEMPQGR